MLMMRLTDNDLEFSLCGVVLVAAGLEILDFTAYAGRDEIVYLTTLVIAIYEYISGKKKTGFIFLVLTVAFCPLMLIPIMIIFVLQEKRIWKNAADAELLVLQGPMTVKVKKIEMINQK